MGICGSLLGNGKSLKNGEGKIKAIKKESLIHYHCMKVDEIETLLICMDLWMYAVRDMSGFLLDFEVHSYRDIPSLLDVVESLCHIYIVILYI